MINSNFDNDRWIASKKAKLCKGANMGKRREVTTTVKRLPAIINGNNAPEIGELIKQLTTLKMNETDHAVAYACLLHSM